MSTLFLYFLVPLLSAGIGWLTNRLAITMLFRPRKPVRFLGMSYQGLLPRRHMQIAERAAEILEREILSKDMLREEIGRIDLKPYLEAAVRHAVRERLGKKMKLRGLINLMMDEGDLYAFERAIAAGLADQMEPLRDTVAEVIQEHVKIREIVQRRLADLDVSQFEDVVRRIAGKELRAIELWGAVLGFLIGCFQAGLLALAR
jgi:uncharacterized membrane protein YheB (UPF0754 family)